MKRTLRRRLAPRGKRRGQSSGSVGCWNRKTRRVTVRPPSRRRHTLPTARGAFIGRRRRSTPESMSSLARLVLPRPVGEALPEPVPVRSRHTTGCRPATAPQQRALCPVSPPSSCVVLPRHSWFCEYPCDESSSRSCLFHCSAHTWLCVSTELSIWPVLVFQNLMHRSAVPPPEASRLAWKGHQASAFTAA